MSVTELELEPEHEQDKPPDSPRTRLRRAVRACDMTVCGFTIIGAGYFSVIMTICYKNQLHDKCV